MTCVARWKADVSDLFPDWPHPFDPSQWLVMEAEKVWNVEAELAHFLDFPTPNGHAETCADFAADLVASIRNRMTHFDGTAMNETARLEDRELVALQHRAEHCHAQWQLLCAAYPQTIFEVPF